jgi:hypothetical protein
MKNGAESSTYEVPGGVQVVTDDCTWQGATFLSYCEAADVIEDKMHKNKQANVWYYAQMVNYWGNK